MRANVALTLLMVLLGVTIGVGTYTFIYARGYSYLSNNPSACTNCHVMRGYYDGWINSSHRGRGARDEVGELWIRGPHVSSGYWNQPDATAATFDSDGWLHTGDLARCDEDGFHYIAGRLKDMIISGGVNVYPAKVEAELLQHPSTGCRCHRSTARDLGRGARGFCCSPRERGALCLKRISDFPAGQVQGAGRDCCRRKPAAHRGKVIKAELQGSYLRATATS